MWLGIMGGLYCQKRRLSQGGVDSPSGSGSRTQIHTGNGSSIVRVFVMGFSRHVFHLEIGRDASKEKFIDTFASSANNDQIFHSGTARQERCVDWDQTQVQAFQMVYGLLVFQISVDQFDVGVIIRVPSRWKYRGRNQSQESKSD